MELNFDQIFGVLGKAIEVIGVAIMIIGGIGATIIYGRRMLARKWDNAYHAYRSSLGRAILLGLEFLVAGDIIGTVAIEPTYETLGVLAAIVGIRTFLSFSLEAEIDGHWPWQRSNFENPQKTIEA